MPTDKMDSHSLCFLVVLAVSAVLLFLGFFKVLEKQLPSESDGQTIQKQLRGFGMMSLAGVVLLAGSVLCFAGTAKGRGLLQGSPLRAMA